MNNRREFPSAGSTLRSSRHDQLSSIIFYCVCIDGDYSKRASREMKTTITPRLKKRTRNNITGGKYLNQDRKSESVCWLLLLYRLDGGGVDLSLTIRRARPSARQIYKFGEEQKEFVPDDCRSSKELHYIYTHPPERAHVIYNVLYIYT